MHKAPTTTDDLLDILSYYPEDPVALALVYAIALQLHPVADPREILKKLQEDGGTTLAARVSRLAWQILTPHDGARSPLLSRGLAAAGDPHVDPETQEPS